MLTQRVDPCKFVSHGRPTVFSTSSFQCGKGFCVSLLAVWAFGKPSPRNNTSSMEIRGGMVHYDDHHINPSMSVVSVMIFVSAEV